MNRSEAEGTELTTRWTLLADPSKESVERARAFLKNAKPGKTAEGLAVRLLTEKPASAEDIVRRQNPDGGWASLDGGASDAFATGQILYALGTAGVPGGGAAVPKARKYLIDTQGADGSWTVPPLALTPPDTKPERLARLEPIYRYWGSAWAAIGLLRTLPRS